MMWGRRERGDDLDLTVRIVPGITGPDGPTTYEEVRRQAQAMMETDWRTPVEAGLAKTILAIIHDVEKHIIPAVTDHL